jgi:hypothetical protein
LPAGRELAISDNGGLSRAAALGYPPSMAEFITATLLPAARLQRALAFAWPLTSGIQTRCWWAGLGRVAAVMVLSAAGS